MNTLTSVSSGNSRVDKAVAGVRTLVVAGSKVYEGLPATETTFNKVEEMFKEPIAYTGLHAIVEVLTMADGIKKGVLMPAVVRAFMAAQLQLVSIFALVLRLGRLIALRLLQTIGAAADSRQAAAVSIVSVAMVESRSIVENEYLDLMRFQCYGFSQMVGSEGAWGQAVKISSVYSSARTYAQHIHSFCHACSPLARPRTLCSDCVRMLVFACAHESG